MTLPIAPLMTACGLMGDRASADPWRRNRGVQHWAGCGRRWEVTGLQRPNNRGRSQSGGRCCQRLKAFVQLKAKGSWEKGLEARRDGVGVGKDRGCWVLRFPRWSCAHEECCLGSGHCPRSGDDWTRRPHTCDQGSVGASACLWRSCRRMEENDMGRGV